MTAVGAPSDPELLKLVARTCASPKDDQVLVKVSAAALNPIDYKINQGHMAVVATPPLWAGFDFCGVVEEAGAKSGFSVGDEVFGDCPNIKGLADPVGGSLSEYIVVPSNIIAKKPEKCTPVEAASLALVGQTVLDCITKADPKSDARVLILGASGGVGTAAVQICKARGFHVSGVCSGKNKDLVLSLGADEVIDYKEHDWSEKLKDDKMDVVFDFAPSGAHSSESWDKAMKVLISGGKFITISGPDEHGEVTIGKAIGLMAAVGWRNVFSGFKYHLVLKASAAAKVQELSRLVDEGKLKSVVEKVYPFAEAPAAFAHLMSGRAVGKVCIDVQG